MSSVELHVGPSGSSVPEEGGLCLVAEAESTKEIITP